MPTTDHADAVTARNDRGPFFFKQWGGRNPTSLGRDLDGHVRDRVPGWSP